MRVSTTAHPGQLLTTDAVNDSSPSSSRSSIAAKAKDGYDSAASSSTASLEAGSAELLAPSTTNWLSDHVANGPWLDLELLMLTFCTGLIDTVLFSSHKMFATKQTGNVLFIMMSILDVPGASAKAPADLAICIFAFILGAVLQGHAGNVCGCRRRIWLVLASMFSTAPLYAAAAIQWRFIDSRASGAIAFEGQASMGAGAWLVGLCAFSYGSQFALSLAARGAELNTSVVTSALVNLSTDSGLIKRENPNRTLRAFFIASIATGAMVGAVALKLGGPAAGILLAAICRTAVGLLFLLNPRDGTLTAQG